MKASQQQRELVRLLYLEHGHQRASELSKVPYATVRQWSHRYGWDDHSKLVTNVTKQVADRLTEEIAEDERETRSSLSRSARRLAKDAESVTLRDAEKVLTVAKTAGIVHRWDAKANSQANVMVNVAILGIDPDSVKATIIDQPTDLD